MSISEIIGVIDDWAWSYPLLILLVGTGLFLSIRLVFVQFRRFGFAMKTTLGKVFTKQKAGKGEVTPFQALCTALAATVGTGNIVGVTGAIILGGPGAVFWMWLIALAGSSTAFVESTLAQLYKQKHKDSFIGGPAYYIQKGLKQRWMAVLFAILITCQFGLSNNSIQKLRTHLYDLWKFMKKNPHKYDVKENVVADAEYGEIEKFEATILTADQANDLIRHCVLNERDYSTFAMVGLPVLAGLRRGELCGLRWKDVDFKKKRIDVANQRVQISTGSIEKVPKGGKDNGKTREERKQRYAGLPDCLATLLHYVWDQQKDLLDRDPKPEEYVFMTKTNLVNGYPPHPGKISRRFSELQKRMNKIRAKANKPPIPQVRLHDLRHTFISLCLNGGVNQFQVAANCGHTFEKRGSTTTIATYWHDDSNRDEIIAFIDKTITAKLKIPDMRE